MKLTAQIQDAHRRIKDNILNTPLLHSRWLSNVCNGTVYLKMESEQYTGSFKARGSLNKLMWIKENDFKQMPVTASTGNHGLGFARALDLLNMKGKVFLPKGADSSKVEAIQSYGADLEFYGNDPYTTEMHTRKLAKVNDWIYVSPYNDEQIIAGQGTIGTEILDKIGKPDNILATVGGGGLISGIGSIVKEKHPQAKIIGCQPENSPEMSVSVRAGEYKDVESKPTLSDGSAGGFEKDAITFELCKKLVDDFILVSEENIEECMRLMIEKHHKLVEGSAAVAVAGPLLEPERFAGQTTVIVICGANISLETLKKVL